MYIEQDGPFQDFHNLPDRKNWRMTESTSICNLYIFPLY